MNVSPDPFGIPVDQPLDQPAPVIAVARPRRGWKVAVFAFAGIVVVGGGAALAALHWLTNTDQGVAERIPADAGIYIGIDALRLQDEDTKALMSTITEMVANATDDASTTSTFAAVDQALQDEFGFDFSNDIKPWVGRSMAFFAMPFDDFDPAMSSFDPNLEGAFVVQVRDADRADAFLQKAVVALAGNEEELLQTEYSGVIVYENETLALVHVDGIMAIGDPSSVHRIIDLQPADSLAEQAMFVASTEQLPADRLLTVYVSDNFFGALADPLSASPLTFSQQFPITAGSLTVVPEGFRLDSSARLNGQQETDIYETYASLDAAQIADVFPVGAYGFVIMPGLADLWDAFTATDPDGVIKDSVDSAVSELGYDPVENLFPLLDRGTGLTAVPVSDGPMEFPFGVAATFETSDPQKLAQELEKLVISLEPMGVGLERQGDTYSTDGFAIGVVEDRLQITFNMPFEDLGGKPSILSDETYNGAAADLDGLAPYFYLDTAKILDDAVTDDSMRAALAPMGPVVAGQSVDGGWAKAAVFVHLTYAAG